MRKVQTRVAALAVTIVLCALSGGEFRGQANTAAAVVQAAAMAMGGADKLKAVRNITLRGYGMYVYQNGAGRITGEPEAPEKYIAANDMERIYDLEHNRLRISERRNNLFPFLGDRRPCLEPGGSGAGRRHAGERSAGLARCVARPAASRRGSVASGCGTTPPPWSAR